MQYTHKHERNQLEWLLYVKHFSVFIRILNDFNKNFLFIAIFRAIRNRFKFVEASSFARIDLLLGAKTITLFFIWRVENNFYKNSQIFKKIYFFLLHLIFSFYYCSIDLERQPEKSVVRPDTSSIVSFSFQIIPCEWFFPYNSA